ncbi:type II toxin-antitoxin system Phd/YefM family antitoxin [Catenuloplanes atrovinosus]|uniref:Antitoxin (DNA-binding transcriptional repressor) of toxin-antitoxin stability system n=1 Tax=Catenuloplanes atrovinosus TaxID=137266 RepID=A0AAE3YPM3_9ACTN|nr:type II toxin-antitoxin system Phd/YefM family antitoxin [Catenuloplanes atrovinosus]MDR7276325.1 antitoxin (DNA-binding transcriptional repressor) of toxin-antitoxin stability system [Catenuloplanes atrovinosus]
MAHLTPIPAEQPRPRQVISQRDARTRLSHLLARTGPADIVTVIADGDRPLAALVPVPAAQSAAEAAAAARRAGQVAAGWSARLETLRAQLLARHAAETESLVRALSEAWAELDRRCPPGRDATVDHLRAAHLPLLADDRRRAA